MVHAPTLPGLGFEALWEQHENSAIGEFIGKPENYKNALINQPSDSV